MTWIIISYIFFHFFDPLLFSLFFFVLFDLFCYLWSFLFSLVFFCYLWSLFLLSCIIDLFQPIIVYFQNCIIRWPANVMIVIYMQAILFFSSVSILINFVSSIYVIHWCMCWLECFCAILCCYNAYKTCSSSILLSTTFKAFVHSETTLQARQHMLFNGHTP